MLAIVVTGFLVEAMRIGGNELAAATFQAHGAAFLDDVLRHEATERRVRHARGDAQHQIGGGVGASFFRRQQLEQQLRRQFAEALRHRTQHRLQLRRIGFRHQIDDAAQHANQRGGLGPGGDVARLLERHDEFAEPLDVAAHLHQLVQRLVVQRRLEVQARADDVIPLGVLARAAIAKDVGVIDLLNVEVPMAAGGPQPADAAGGAHFIDGTREQPQEGQPRFRFWARVHRDNADQVVVQHGARLAHRLVGLRCAAAAEQQVVGQHAEGDRTCGREPGRGVDEARE